MKHVMRWLLVLVLVLFVAPIAAQQEQTEAATTALEWTRTQQIADGSFNGFGLGSTADALIAFGSSGFDLTDENVASTLDYVEAQASEIAASPGAAAKYVLGLLWTGADPRDVAGSNLVTAVQDSFDSTTGVYGPDVTSHALAMLALVAANEPVEPAAVTALEGFQLADGSWSFTGDKTADSGDTNTTALVIQALIASGNQENAAVTKALEYLHTQQNPDGGFPYSQASEYGNASDSNSTALVLQALIAAEENLDADWANTDGTPLESLAGFQNESGAFAYTAEMPDDNTVATYQSIPALQLKSFPLSAVAAPVAIPASGTAPDTTAPTQTLPSTGAPVQPWLPVLVVIGFGVVLLGIRMRRVA